jgi:hypothetical protein
MPIYSNKFWKSIDYTTRKSEKTNGITDKIFSSKFFTDGHNSVSKSVGIYRPYHRRTIQFFWKVATVRWRGFVQTMLPMKLPRDSNRDSRTVMWHFHQRNHRRTRSVGDAIGKSQYIPTLPTLSSSVSPSSSASHLSPPKLQPTTYPNSPIFSTQTLKFLILLYMVTTSVLMDFIIFCK